MRATPTQTGVSLELNQKELAVVADIFRVYDIELEGGRIDRELLWCDTPDIRSFIKEFFALNKKA